jgi:hypothetical protein
MKEFYFDDPQQIGPNVSCIRIYFGVLHFPKELEQNVYLEKSNTSEEETYSDNQEIPCFCATRTKSPLSQKPTTTRPSC